MSGTTRRTFLSGTCATITGSSLPADLRAQTRVSEDMKATTDVIEMWLDQLVTARGEEGVLHVGRFRDRFYFLTNPISWLPNPGQGEKLRRVDVPPGFVTDFASIPRIFWALLPPDGEYAYAAVIHDFLYWDQSIPRADADLILRIAMQDFSVSTATVFAIYNAVRAFGGEAWRANALLKNSGEKRILTKFPKDATTAWADWKLTPKNFCD